MQSLEVSGAVRPIYGSLGVKRLSWCRNWARGRKMAIFFKTSMLSVRSTHPPIQSVTGFFHRGTGAGSLSRPLDSV